jgi:hypothetical protein
MNKKLLSVAALVLTLGAANMFAVGIGAQAGYVAGPNASNGALTFKLDETPWVFALNVEGISSNYLGIGITADRWLANKTIEAPLAYYYGWGLAGSAIFTESDYSAIFLGGRALIGLNAFVVDDFLELYAQAAWQPGVNIRFHDNSSVELVTISFPINIGFRFWL